MFCSLGIENREQWSRGVKRNSLGGRVKNQGVLKRRSHAFFENTYKSKRGQKQLPSFHSVALGNGAIPTRAHAQNPDQKSAPRLFVKRLSKCANLCGFIMYHCLLDGTIILVQIQGRRRLNIGSLGSMYDKVEDPPPHRQFQYGEFLWLIKNLKFIYKSRQQGRIICTNQIYHFFLTCLMWGRFHEWDGLFLHSLTI